MASLTLQHAQKIRLARDDLERMVQHLPEQVFDDVVKGCTVKVLLEEENQARVYRIAWITGVDQATVPYKFGATLVTAKTLILDFCLFKMSYQMNTISNSEFSEDEFRQWVITCGQAIPFDAQGADAKAADLARVFDEYPEASRLGRQRRVPAQRRLVAAHVPPPTARRNDGHLSTACNDLLEQFTRQRPWLSTDQQDLVKSFATHVDEYVAKERQRMLHSVQRAEDALRRADEPPSVSVPTQVGGRGGRINGSGSFSMRRGGAAAVDKVEAGTVTVTGNVDVMNIEELKRVVFRLEEMRKSITEKIEEKTKCIICLEHDARIVLLPCKHQVLCRACSAKCESCPMCRADIKDRFEPFVG